jgi:hypothetical protein
MPFIDPGRGCRKGGKGNGIALIIRALGALLFFSMY